MKKYLVIGKPINHSLSPDLHNYWIKKYKIDAFYEKKEITEEHIETLINELKEKKINGINVTVPFKKTVIPYLDKLTLEANSTQSVNTIYFRKNEIIGHNTDIEGFEISLNKIKYDITNKEVFILGSGGVVPSIIFALKKMRVSKITISNRTKTKAEDLKNLLVKQIENRVRWRESVINMIKNNVNHFIEIGPGKVLSGLVKRINKEVKISTINNQNDIESLEI